MKMGSFVQLGANAGGRSRTAKKTSLLELLGRLALPAAVAVFVVKKYVLKKKTGAPAAAKPAAEAPKHKERAKPRREFKVKRMDPEAAAEARAQMREEALRAAGVRCSPPTARCDAGNA